MIRRVASAFVLMAAAAVAAAEPAPGAPAPAAVESEQALKKKLDDLARAAAATTAAADFSKLAVQFLGLTDAAVRSDAFETTERGAAAALRAAQGSGEGWQQMAASGRLQDIKAMRPRFAAVVKARQTLAASPDDPAANLDVGRFECFVKGNWTEELPLLAKGGDAPLAALAAQDQAAPPDAAAQGALGDGWWAQAEKEDGIARAQVRRRAVHWYAAAWPQLDDEGRKAFRKRVAIGIPSSLPRPPMPPSPTVGGGGGDAFEDRPPFASILVGFRYCMGTIVTERAGDEVFTHPILKVVQPVYLSERGTFNGQIHGNPSASLSDLVAKPGYAVGAMVIKGGARVDGFKIVFMKMSGLSLDPSDSYESRWIGGKGGDQEKQLGGDGAYVIGIHGRSGKDLDCLGILQAGK